jgi:hypothetical protein
MAITHQTDTEQRVIDVPISHHASEPKKLTLSAPHGGHPHSLAPQGYYMLFALNHAGVPSVAAWVNLC